MKEQEVIRNLSTRDSCGVFPGFFVTVREYFVSGSGGESSKPQVFPAEGEYFPGNPKGCLQVHIAIPRVACPCQLPELAQFKVHEILPGGDQRGIGQRVIRAIHEPSLESLVVEYLAQILAAIKLREG